MSKVFRCRDVGFDCYGDIRAETESEAILQAAEHARTAHGFEVTPEVDEQVRAVMHGDPTEA